MSSPILAFIIRKPLTKSEDKLPLKGPRFRVHFSGRWQNAECDAFVAVRNSHNYCSTALHFSAGNQKAKVT